MLGNHEYQFTLGNFTKPKSLFNNGMKILMYSKKKEKKESKFYIKKKKNIFSMKKLYLTLTISLFYVKKI